MQSTSSRKGRTSITHLMNFTLPPRPQHVQHQHRRLPWRGHSSLSHLDKAKYIHANYRFIVKPKGDYRRQAGDPDVHLDWDDVLQILASEDAQSTSCPICLSTPVAPRITKCGHIFCLPCLIRYMYAADETAHIPEKKSKYKKCPLCEDIIFVPEARPVRWLSDQDNSALRVGDDVVLRLMMRYPGGILALPRDAAESVDRSEFIPWCFTAEVFGHARIMMGGEEYMEEQYEQEIADVEAQEAADELMFMDDTARWSKRAVAVIRDSKERLKGIGTAPLASPRPQTPVDRKLKRKASVVTSDPESASRDHGNISLCEEKDALVSSDDVVGSTPRSPSANTTIASATVRPLDAPFYFYEAPHRFYLSPLDTRILKAAFGDYSLFPTTILPRIEHRSGNHVVDDDLRRRAKYLAHLPSGCEIGFIECDWTDVVAPDVLARFASDIERRRQHHKDKQAREDKEDRIRAGRDEDEKRWAAARRRQRTEGLLHEDEFEPLPAVEEGLGSSPPWSARQDQGSFYASLASPSTSPAAPKTVWGTTQVPAVSPPIIAEPEATEDDGWLQPWDMSGLGNAMVSPPNMGGKKKKNKKITLMSTNGFRGA